MINIYLDETMKNYLLIKSLLNKYLNEYTIMELKKEELPTSIYIGKRKNKPNHNFIKSFYEVEEESNLEKFDLNDLLFLQDTSTETISLMIKRIPSIIKQRNKIVEDFSEMVHDIMNDTNHINGYSQLLKLRAENDPEMEEECDVLVEAGSEINKRISDIRKKSFKLIF